MITPEIFNRNEAMRKKLSDAMDVLEMAFHAVQAEDDAEWAAVLQHDALAYSMAYARRLGVIRFKERLRNLAQVHKETIGPIEATYAGTTPFDQIAIDAENEYKQTHPIAIVDNKPKTNKK